MSTIATELRGRPKKSAEGSYEACQKMNVSMTPELMKRLERYLDEQERSRSWAVRKAIDEWLKKEGY